MNADELKVKLTEYLANEILKQPGRTILPGEALLSSGLIDFVPPRGPGVVRRG